MSLIPAFEIGVWNVWLLMLPLVLIPPIMASVKKGLFKKTESTANLSKPEKRVKVFEMGESGQSVAFPMTAEEIDAEDAENEGLAAARKAKSEEPPKHIVIYEFAESGITVEFPLETPDEAVTDVVAEKNPQKIQKFN